ncbi:hypothetical protein I350_00318 [Cryptococcus amylolentus CBS 6273]|nr:hypothetical protein I350_00318 [Cryptococcus amylolentus CBS 6273]
MTTAQRPIQPLSNPSPYASAPESSPEVSASAPSAFVPSVSYPSHPQAAPKFSSMVDYDDFTSDFGGLNTPPATVDAASSLVNGDASRGGDKGEINTGSSTAG